MPGFGYNGVFLIAYHPLGPSTSAEVTDDFSCTRVLYRKLNEKYKELLHTISSKAYIVMACCPYRPGRTIKFDRWVPQPPSKVLDLSISILDLETLCSCVPFRYQLQNAFSSSYSPICTETPASDIDRPKVTHSAASHKEHYCSCFSTANGTPRTSRISMHPDLLPNKHPYPYGKKSSDRTHSTCKPSLKSVKIEHTACRICPSPSYTR